MATLRRDHAPCLLAATLLALATTLAAVAAAERESPLARLSELDKPITYTATKAPLSELVAAVAQQTGASLTTARPIADEPVSVAVRELPARTLLEQIATLFDYQWQPSRRNGRQNYELWQDAASYNRERDLRASVLRESERAFMLAANRVVEIARLSEDQRLALIESAERQVDALAGLPSEAARARLSLPAAAEISTRGAIAEQMESPILRALGDLLGDALARQTDRLRQSGELIYSSEPGPGENALPDRIASILRRHTPGVYAADAEAVTPGAPVAQNATGLEARIRESWAAGRGYRVVIRLNGLDFAEGGGVALSARATPILADPAALREFDRTQGSSLFVTAPSAASPGRFRLTPEQLAEAEADPVLGARRPFAPKAAPRWLGYAGKSVPGLLRRDLFADLASAYDVQIVADAYTASTAVANLGALTSDRPVSLASRLLPMVAPSHTWERDEQIIRLRSRTWFLDRQREIPVRYGRRWQSVLDQQAALSIDEYAAMAVTLKDAQLRQLPLFAREMDLPPEIAQAYEARHSLRLFAAFPPRERRLLLARVSAFLARMAPGPRQLFVEALRRQTWHQAAGIDPQQLARAQLIVIAEPAAVRIEQQEGALRRQTLQVQPDDTDEDDEPDDPADAAAEGGPSLLEGPGVTAQFVTRLRFMLVYGAGQRSEVTLVVAPLPVPEPRLEGDDEAPASE